MTLTHQIKNHSHLSGLPFMFPGNAFSPSLCVAFSQSLVDHRLNLIEQVGTHQSSNTLKDILSEFDNSELQKNEWPVGVVAHGASVE